MWTQVLPHNVVFLDMMPYRLVGECQHQQWIWCLQLQSSSRFTVNMFFSESESNYTKKNPHCLGGLFSCNIPKTEKLWCMNLTHYGKYGVREASDTWYTIICKSMIGIHENVCVGVYWSDVSVPDWKLSGWSNDIVCMMEGKTEDLEKK
jgi:hypothetical protein